jgi:hypothetical protein
MWDIVLAVGLGAVTLITAYLGSHVTMHPAETAHARTLYKSGFAVCGLIALVLIGVQAYRNNRSQSLLDAQLGRIEKNTKTPPSVEVNVAPAAPQIILNNASPFAGSISLAKIEFPPSLDADPFGINIHLMNSGQAPIADAYYWVTAVFLPIGTIASINDSNAADKKAYSAFLKLGKKALLDARRAGHSPIYYSVGQDQYGAMFLHPRSEEIDGVIHGTVRLYFFAYVEWSGGKSQYIACRWLQPPAEVNYGSGANLVLHDCSW